MLIHGLCWGSFIRQIHTHTHTLSPCSAAINVQDTESTISTQETCSCPHRGDNLMGAQRPRWLWWKMALALMGQWGRKHERGSFAWLGTFRRASKRKCSHFQTPKWSRHSLEGEIIENVLGRNKIECEGPEVKFSKTQNEWCKVGSAKNWGRRDRLWRASRRAYGERRWLKKSLSWYGGWIVKRQDQRELSRCK